MRSGKSTCQVLGQLVPACASESSVATSVDVTTGSNMFPKQICQRCAHCCPHSLVVSISSRQCPASMHPRVSAGRCPFRKWFRSTPSVTCGAKLKRCHQASSLSPSRVSSSTTGGPYPRLDGDGVLEFPISVSDIGATVTAGWGDLGEGGNLCRPRPEKPP